MVDGEICTLKNLGLRVKVLRRSPRTGDFVVRLLDEFRAYKIGTEISVHDYNLDRAS